MNGAEQVAKLEEMTAALGLYRAQLRGILFVPKLAAVHKQTQDIITAIAKIEKKMGEVKAALTGSDAADVPEIRAANLRAIRNDPAIAEKISGAVRDELAKLRKRVNSR